ncbi:MAG: Spy/CpxP family protein refolding chaperone [Phenylobacterium sp.]|uniref:Spy/CpxP family protein refolding chaperone n=1 Tax=Phenylobacterium sp. TaxID=1871053 RepID=UPI0027351A4F|nr:Spy/CpxP family protein refolding chaperone [Phenylobacterium sp.]MDP3750121.1 Spy/CpxP family protein refolding chaperone [Phenylobacterium sp.]
MSRGLTWLLAGAALSLSAGAVLAAEPKPAPAPKTWNKEFIDKGGHAGPDRHVMMPRYGDRDGHLSAILQLRPDQEPALKAYLEAVKPRREHNVGFHHAAEQRSTLARLDEMEARMAEHQAAMQARIAATRTFYAALDERQKRAFDEMPMMMFAGPGFGPMPLGPMAVMHRMPRMHDFDGEPLPPAPPEPPAPPPPRR